MGESIILPVGDFRIFAADAVDPDGNWLVLTTDTAVLMTVRLLEADANPILQLHGLVESIGSALVPGLVSVIMMPDDTKALTPAEYFYDIEIRIPGNYFDQGTHDDLDFYYLYGRTKSTAWHEVAAGHVALTDDDVNYVEVTTGGTVSANTTGFTTGRIPLYTVTTAAGAITVIVDNRTVSGRGDMVYTIVKDSFTLIYGITKPAETEA